MSNGNLNELPGLSGHQAKSALISTAICAVALCGFYFLGGKQALQSQRTAEAVRKQQEAAQELINLNSSHVEGIRQQLESVRGTLANSDNQHLNVEELRQRLTQIEGTLSTLPRLASETRTEIDAASSRTALQNAERLAILSLAEKCEEALQAMKTLTVTWAREYEPLLTDNRGRQISPDEIAVQRCATLMRGDFAVVKDAVDWMAEFEAAVHPLREASEKRIDNYAVTTNDRAYFASLLDRLQDANRQLEHRQRGVDVILATTSKDDPGRLTLGQAIEQLESQTILKMTEEATRLQEQKLQQSINTQAEAIREAQYERIEAETKLRVQQEKLAAREATHSVDVLEKNKAIADAQAQRTKLEKDFLLEQREIEQLLSTFISHGRFDPLPSFTLEKPHMRMMDHPGSMSLGQLASIGALDQTEVGYELLYAIGGHSDNHRPRGGFPNYTYRGMANPTIVSKLKRASELLNKYGQLLIEKRMIAR